MESELGEGESWTETFLREKYQNEIQRCRKLETQLVQIKRKVEHATKEKDLASTQLNRIVAARPKLENICRQLQKQNRTIQEESLQRAQSDTEQRKELSAKFHATIEDITKKMSEHDGDREILLKERNVLKDRIANMREQIELRDQHYAQQLKTKELHIQLASTRLQQQMEILQQDELRRCKYREKLEEEKQSEQLLKQQVQMYGEKFVQFLATLTNSNKVFANFKADLQKMSDRCIALENENKRLQHASAKCEKALLDIMTELVAEQKRLPQLEKQYEKLKNLHGALRAEVGSVVTDSCNTPSE